MTQKFSFLALALMISFPLSTYAKKELPAAIEADYIVPTEPHLVPYSRFKVKINIPYQGDQTQSISYTFPKELSGDPELTVYLTRIPGEKNAWESPQMKAFCTTLGDLFSCNLHFIKSAGRSCNTSAINMLHVQSFLEKSGFAGVELQDRMAVAQSFRCSEPAGILSYEFD